MNYDQHNQHFNIISTLCVIICLLSFFTMISPQNALSVENKITSRYLNVYVTQPETVIVNEEFNISFFISSDYSNSATNVTLKIDLPSEIFEYDDEQTFFIEKISARSTYGKTITAVVQENASSGTHYINYDFLHTYDEKYSVSNAIPINIIDKPDVSLGIKVQQSIYTAAEFPFVVEVQSYGTDLNNLTITINPPDEIEFRGQTKHTLSNINANQITIFRSILVTPIDAEISYEHYIPFYVTLLNMLMMEVRNMILSENVSILLRQKNTFLREDHLLFWTFLISTVAYGQEFLVFIIICIAKCKLAVWVFKHDGCSLLVLYEK